MPGAGRRICTQQANSIYVHFVALKGLTDHSVHLYNVVLDFKINLTMFLYVCMYILRPMKTKNITFFTGTITKIPLLGFFASFAIFMLELNQ